MTTPADLSTLTAAEKDALILALWAQGQAFGAGGGPGGTGLGEPPTTPGNASLPRARR